MEAYLVDYDPINHWGNIAYASGITSNSRYYQNSNMHSVGNRVDPNEIYRKKWLNFGLKPSSHIREDVLNSMLG
jgi:deoxyribodipyrimidine photolyase